MGLTHAPCVAIERTVSHATHNRASAPVPGAFAEGIAQLRSGAACMRRPGMAECDRRLRIFVMDGAALIALAVF